MVNHAKAILCHSFHRRCSRHHRFYGNYVGLLYNIKREQSDELWDTLNKDSHLENLFNCLEDLDYEYVQRADSTRYMA